MQPPHVGPLAHGRTGGPHQRMAAHVGDHKWTKIYQKF
jgi:hypothetical protein